MKDFLIIHKKLIIIVASALLVAGLILIIILNIPKDFAKVKLTNADSLQNTGISSENMYNIKKQIHDNLVANQLISENSNVDDVTIREDTIVNYDTTVDKKKYRNISFIVDIDSAKQTYLVSVVETSEQMTDISVQIKCPNVEYMKYPESSCNGTYGSSSKLVENNVPHEMKLSTGEKVLIKNVESTRGGSQLLQIYLYSCESKNPPIEATKNMVYDWVKQLGDSKLDFYTYNVRSGYCDGDTI